jgi:hypothetical protein
VSRLVDVRHAAEILTQENICSEDALPSSCADDLLTERQPGHRRIDRADGFRVGLLGYGLKNGDRRVRVPVRLSDQSDESAGEGLRHLGQIHRLQPIAVFLEG